MNRIESDQRGFQAITCTCSEHQLTYVGCDCGDTEEGVTYVRVWLDGYASDRKGYFCCSARATMDQIEAHTRKLFGSWAKAYQISRPVPPITETFTPDFIAEMSRDS